MERRHNPNMDPIGIHMYDMGQPIHTDQVKRTNIDIDDELIAEVMKLAGMTTKKATVEAALRALVRRYRRRNALADMVGLGWEGDLDAMREGRGAGEARDSRR